MRRDIDPDDKRAGRLSPYWALQLAQSCRERADDLETVALAVLGVEARLNGCPERGGRPVNLYRGLNPLAVADAEETVHDGA